MDHLASGSPTKEETGDSVIQQIISGLQAGSSYALVALALVLVLKATDVPNFAQAEIGLVAAFVLWTLIHTLGWPYWISVPVALLAAVALAVVIERVLIRPILAESHFATVLMTIGLFVAINAGETLVWGAAPRNIASPFSHTFHISGQVVTLEQIVAVVVGAALAFALTRFFRTSWGIQMRAMAEDRVTPRLLGVRQNRVLVVSWSLAAIVSGIAMILLTESTVLSDQSAQDVIIKGFVAATIGGFTSITGAFVGGLVLGVLEHLAANYISTSSSAAVSLIVVVAILVVRPDGLFGQAKVREV
jgi:branched-chain amino acid transport system permease protein